MKLKKLLTVILCIFILSACTTENKLQKYTRDTLNAGFDTYINLTAYCEDEETFENYFNILQKEFNYYNQLFDIYNSYEGVNNIKTINDNAGISPVKVDKDLIDLIKFSKTYAKYTKNQLNIALGPVLTLWHNEREIAKTNVNKAKVPDINNLKNAYTLTDLNDVIIDEKNSTVYLAKKGMSLDVGSIAKGYATEKVAQKLKNEGLTSGFINAGGNVRIIGSKPENEPFKVGIQIPDPNMSMTSALGVLSLNGNYSMVTSGDYQRFYKVNGVSYHHIIDPKTLYPSSYHRAVTVICEDSAIADALSTSLFTMSLEDGIKLIENLNSKDIKVNAVYVYDSNIKVPDISNFKQIEFKHIVGYDLVYTSDIKDNLSF